MLAYAFASFIYEGRKPDEDNVFEMLYMTIFTSLDNGNQNAMKTHIQQTLGVQHNKQNIFFFINTYSVSQNYSILHQKKSSM